MSDPIFQAPLPERFALASRLTEQLDDGIYRPGTPEHAKVYRRTLALLSTCLVMAEQLNLLDATASLDEISTKSLKYMTIDFHIAKLLDESFINPSEGSVVARLRVAKSALRKFYDFLLVLADHDLLDEALLAQVTPYVFLPEGRYGRSQMPDLLDKIAHSDAKMSPRFKPHKSSSKARNNDSIVFTTNVGGDKNDKNAKYEDVRRDELAKLRKLGRRAVDSMRSCWREIELLIFAVPEQQREDITKEPEEAYLPHILVTAQNIGRGRPPRADVLANPDVDDPNLLAAAGSGNRGYTFDDARNAMKAQGTDYSTKVDATIERPDPHAILGPQGQVLKPFVLTDGRQQIARKVMGTGQVLPTMSIEEAVEYELKNRVKPADPAGPEIDEESELYSDMQTMKARQWDEFTEANPKGAGNTMNRG
ncbi:Type 2A phosphatase-associated protein 42 [Wickerhamiella sorbophila]|uniref:Type 2A phosphatase-associated protein 42 n=1 Tax=Wickerhamiella sorbophila TaxID=45607 RepID=A0A2T0FNP5_9ASCO|nr:Type 2A phosphatase-associated protein 42 [Wickerhamiella sorbophila]PRT56604.1 Type 2A phosphatase-associated protein 42 [Wickerhamiella sorbophila]